MALAVGGVRPASHLTREGTAALSASLGDRTDPVITEPAGPARASMGPGRAQQAGAALSGHVNGNALCSPGV